MASHLPFACTFTAAPRHAAALSYALLLLPAATVALAASAAQATPDTQVAANLGKAPGPADDGDISTVRPRYGPPGDAPGVPPDAELEAAGALIGEVLIDNQNIFDLNDPKDDIGVFRLANKLHVKTRPRVVRARLLFKPGDHFSRRLIDESERLLRAENYFYDAWIRIVAYHDGKVDLRVTTRDVWTLNPGISYSRSGGTTSTGLKLQEVNFLGTGTALTVAHANTVDRSGNSVGVSARNPFGNWVAVDAEYANLSDGHLRALSFTRPFYALDTPWSGSVAGLDNTQIDPLYDRGNVVDEFRERHEFVQAYYGWSKGLQAGWVRRWTTGLTYDAHRFAPVTTSNGTTTLLPEDRQFLYPFLQFDLVQDDYLRLWNHDQIARTEDFFLGTTASARLGWAQEGAGSSQSALIMQGASGKGLRNGASTLILGTDFSGRLESGNLRNGVLDAAVRYYVEQSKNWLFFTTLQGTKGWALDQDNQILLGGDNGLRGYPLRYQAGTARALFTLEQRYFTDWYPFRLFRVGGAIFFDMGRTWGSAPLAAPSLGLLTDAGFGLRFGNARSALGNVIHVDLAFPFNGDSSIKRVQLLVQTQVRF